MPQTYLIFDPYLDTPPTVEVVLTGNVEVSPLVICNGINYTLFASYTHTDQTTENLYRPLFNPFTHANTQ